MTLIAKPVIKDQYWVVTNGERKVGNVIAEGSGFDVKLDGILKHFNNTTDITKFTTIRFQPTKSNKAKAQIPYPEYPTTSRIYNSMFDIKRKLHLFTKSKKSKCYHVAGWFVLKQNNIKQVSFCPKYIFIQRYEYTGPYKTEDEAKCEINSL
ncbi:hypothetical protein EBU91_00075 [bacterium]|nr:hypothetical protein [bacterium]